uniref:Uncharacterized protein n=1 Tax=Physcomitrium patens TaxID=3218 RepID=A0A2K1KBI1_PHYPA|nr:hypothetical protein PHYPA_010322 [Physcomitrium patens]
MLEADFCFRGCSSQEVPIVAVVAIGRTLLSNTSGNIATPDCHPRNRETICSFTSMRNRYSTRLYKKGFRQSLTA